MSFIKYKVFFLVLLFSLSSKTFSQSAVFEDGEELYYDVYYSFISIGWVKFNTTKIRGSDDRYLCEAILKSNEGLPFVTVSYKFTSEIEIKDNNIRPVRFESQEFKDNKTSTLTYNFNYDSSFVDIRKIDYSGSEEYHKNMHLYTTYQDGLSIFYYARYNLFKNGTTLVPVLMNQDSTSMLINFSTAKKDVKISNISYDISSVFVDGTAYFIAVFGLTGDFTGWFSNDEARIPVKSKLKVKIGNITLELASWKRKNWAPPHY